VRTWHGAVDRRLRRYVGGAHCALNIGLRAFPDAGRRVARGLAELTSPDYDDERERDRRLRVFVSWKAMIVGSVILTIVVNLVPLVI
jgi:hypothetical protein